MERRQAMGLKGLAEGIILQSIEDLWSESHRGESIAFFTGKEFSVCAGLAEMNLPDQLKVLNLVKGVVGYTMKSSMADEESLSQRRKRPAKSARKLCRVAQAVS
jgi:hypothetical protein